MVQTSGNERLTAFVSTIVAVAILAAGVTAHQSAAPTDTDIMQVASDLRFQLEMAFRHDLRERESRLAQFDAVMAAWNIAPQSYNDRELLLGWLREAGTNSLPGVRLPLPPVPDFSKSGLVLADSDPAAKHQVGNHQVRKLSSPEIKLPETQQPDFRKQTQSQHVIAAPSLESAPLSAQNPVKEKTPVTPTPADPLEEEMIALRQPQSLTMGSHEVEPGRLAIAPRPGIAEQPRAIEQNLLASVPVANNKLATPVAVNFTELAARIAGYHDGLDEVELALLRMNTPDLAVVREQVEKLDSMTRDYGFVRLYYDSLTPQERQSVLEPRSMQATLVEVQRQLKRCEEAGDGDFLGTLDAQADRELADLRARIAEIERRTER
jgi:hypothetical protein